GDDPRPPVDPGDAEPVVADRAEDAGDVGAVPVHVGPGVGVGRRFFVVGRGDEVAAQAVLEVGGEVRVVRVDPGVDDRDPAAAAGADVPGALGADVDPGGAEEGRFVLVLPGVLAHVSQAPL